MTGLSPERELAAAVNAAVAAAYAHGFAVAADNGTRAAKELAARESMSVLREAWYREFGSAL